MAALDYTFERREVLIRKEEHEDGYIEGENDGIQKGKDSLLLEQIKKKIAKNKTINVIADELEVSEKEVADIIKRNNL